MKKLVVITESASGNRVVVEDYESLIDLIDGNRGADYFVKVEDYTDADFRALPEFEGF